jgi:hypothetical protein
MELTLLKGTDAWDLQTFVHKSVAQNSSGTASFAIIAKFDSVFLGHTFSAAGYATIKSPVPAILRPTVRKTEGNNLSMWWCATTSQLLGHSNQTVFIFCFRHLQKLFVVASPNCSTYFERWYNLQVFDNYLLSSEQH